MIFRFSSNGLAHTAKLRDSRQQQRGLTRGCCSMVLLKRGSSHDRAAKIWCYEFMIQVPKDSILQLLPFLIKRVKTLVMPYLGYIAALLQK